MNVSHVPRTLQSWVNHSIVRTHSWRFSIFIESYLVLSTWYLVFSVMLPYSHHILGVLTWYEYASVLIWWYGVVPTCMHVWYSYHILYQVYQVQQYLRGPSVKKNKLPLYVFIYIIRAAVFETAVPAVCFRFFPAAILSSWCNNDMSCHGKRHIHCSTTKVWLASACRPSNVYAYIRCSWLSSCKRHWGPWVCKRRHLLLLCLVLASWNEVAQQHEIWTCCNSCLVYLSWH